MLKIVFCDRNSCIIYRAVLQDLKHACRVFPSDPELHIVRETLQLAQDGLNADPNELAGQLIARIYGTGSDALLEQAKRMEQNSSLSEDARQIMNLLEAFEATHKEKNKVP